MNAIQQGQNVEAPAVNAIAEAVRGLARDRSLLVKELRETNRNWIGFDAFAKENAEKIAAIDRRIDCLVALNLGKVETT
jgi:hypothetical protein